MEAELSRQREWIRALCAWLGMSPSQLAAKAKLAPSTINKPLNDPDYSGRLSERTMRQIADAVGFEPLQMPQSGGARLGLAEIEATPFEYRKDDSATDNFERAVRDICQGHNGRNPWVAKGRALDMYGILPGDILIVDLNMQPKAGDIACAQIVSNWSRGRAETVFRLYQPPYLLTHSTEGQPGKPEMVDNDNVMLRGKVVGALRNFNGR